MSNKTRPMSAKAIHLLGMLIAILSLVFLAYTVVQWYLERKIEKQREKESGEIQAEKRTFFALMYDKAKDQINVRINGRWVIIFGTVTAGITAMGAALIAPAADKSFPLFFFSLIMAGLVAQAVHNDDRISQLDTVTERMEIEKLGPNQSINALRRQYTRHKKSRGFIRKFSFAIVYVGIEAAMVLGGIYYLKVNLLQLSGNNMILVLQGMLILSIVSLFVTLWEIIYVE